MDLTPSGVQETSNLVTNVAMGILTTGVIATPIGVAIHIGRTIYKTILPESETSKVNRLTQESQRQSKLESTIILGGQRYVMKPNEQIY